jgi:hypothetical protein
MKKAPMDSSKARRLLWVAPWCASLALAALAGAFVARGFQDTALTSEEIERVKAVSPTSGPPYSSLEPLICKRGLVRFVKALLSEDDPRLRTVGLRIAWHHRLYMLKQEILHIVSREDVDQDLRGLALTALASSGVSLEEVLQGVPGDEIKKAAIWEFAAAADDERHDLAARIRWQIRWVFENEKQPLPIRRAAWGALADSGGRPTIVQVAPSEDEVLVEWARKLKLSDAEYARGLFLRKGPLVQKELVGLLESPDMVARMWAAHGLVYRFKDRHAAPRLVESLPRYDVPMAAFGSVGNCAFQTLARIDDGVLLKRAIGHLSQQENGPLEGIVEPGQDPEEALLAVQEYMESERESEAKNRVAAAIADWLRPRLRHLRWSEDGSKLRLMDEPPPGQQGAWRETVRDAEAR